MLHVLPIRALSLLFLAMFLNQIVVLEHIFLFKLGFRRLFVTIFKYPLVIDVVYSSLVPGDTSVLSHLDMAVRVPPYKDRRIVWHEFNCL